MEQDRRQQSLTGAASFEANLIRLEQVVKMMESGEIALEQSFHLFQEGIDLVRLCHGQLDQIETKVQTLMEESAPKPLQLFGDGE